MKIHTNKKGVSPLIATVLLIVFAIAIASILLSWLGGYTSDTTEKAKSASDTTVACSKQAVDIVRIYTISSSNETIGRVDVQAVGQDPVVVKDILVSTTGSSAPCDFAPTDVTQSPGNITTYTSSSCTVTCDTVDTVRVVTSCGGVTAVHTGNTSIVNCR